jgi:hypothetical protein
MQTHIQRQVTDDTQIWQDYAPAKRHAVALKAIAAFERYLLDDSTPLVGLSDVVHVVRPVVVIVAQTHGHTDTRT